MKFLKASVIVVVACFALVAADAASAKDNKPNKGGKKKDGVSLQIEDKPGKKAKGAKAIPPGQIKRYTRGAKLPSDLNYKDIGDLSKWKLDEPGKGNRYIRVDDEILEVSDDLSTVVDAVGIVGDLLK
ncbi:hypothetical protein Q8W37_02570 [Shimia thalassica]|uniref:hypothetical protein n=1 Tax=Shimia thalassica TaxID=1715693 RepID=UPI002736D9B5|nr:hypothetical protein [Shimia thalassica]MDP2578797.1 hypothetical protein [Shimia thalassica]